MFPVSLDDHPSLSVKNKVILGFAALNLQCTVSCKNEGAKIDLAAYL